MITVDKRENSIWVSIVGQFEYEISEEFLRIIKERLLNTNTKGVSIDLSRVNYINSIGIGTIVTAFKLLKDKGKEMSIINPQDNVMKVIKLTKINEIIPVLNEGAIK